MGLPNRILRTGSPVFVLYMEQYLIWPRAKFEHYQNSFLWLKNAGVALPVYNIEEPKIPLLLSRSRNLFKLF